MKLVTHNAEETVALGRKIGALLRPNDCLALTGQLGAGKTTLIQGIAEELGVAADVTSPTFIIINEYQGRLPLYHMDLYRLDDHAAIEDLGIEEYFNKKGICVIEWAEKIQNQLPPQTQQIVIKITAESQREIDFSPELTNHLSLG